MANSFLLLALIATPLAAQSLRVYSEFWRVDPFGKLADAGQPREILSPAVARNAFASFQIVVEVPPGKPFWLHVAQNPDETLRPELYREVWRKAPRGWIPDRLEPVKLPATGRLPESAQIEGQTVFVYWLDLWTPAETPAARMRVEAQLVVDERWIIYPIEVRVEEAIVPPVRNRGTPSVQNFIRRNIAQIAALARARNAATPQEDASSDPERYARLRDDLLLRSPVPARTVAFTFDDLPKPSGRQDLPSVRSTTRRLLSTLTAHKVPAIGFVNESKLHVRGELDARTGMLRRWLDAGMTLGNHTYSHPRFDKTPVPEYLEDILRGELITRRLVEQRGQTLKYFRHPFTSTGATQESRDALDEFLKKHGYSVAPFTVEHADYLFNVAYVRALERNDAALARRIREAYVDFLDVVFAYFERRSRELLGREVAQILLVHANDLNARCLDEMIWRLRARGYSFITLDQALADPAYQLKDGYIGPAGISWLHRWAVGMGQVSRHAEEPDPPKFVMDAAK